MKKLFKKPCAIVLSAALAASLVSGYAPSASAASKSTKVKLSASSLKLTVGQTKKVTIKKPKKQGIKKVTWTVSKKGKKIVKLSKKTKTGVSIKALKKGTATVTAKVKLAKKTVTKSVKITVKNKANNNKKPTTKPTAKPTASPTVAPSPTKLPISSETYAPKPTSAVYGNAGEVSAYDKEKTNYTLNIDSSNKVHEISDILYGIFIEDINFAADGGLYAEMVRNRSFEFTKLAADNEKHGWTDVGTVVSEVVTNDSTGCLNANNPNYMVLTNNSAAPAGISNKGFLDGMSVIKDAEYKFSIYAKGMDGYTGPVHVAIMNGDKSVANADIPSVTSSWKKYELTLKSAETSNKNVSLSVTIDKGKAAIDMVSLFPADTYKGRENGLRRDLAEKLEALHPSFLRFPGGCVVEGVNLQNAYDWKASIGVGSDGEPLLFNQTYGDVAARKQGQNIWTDEAATNDANPCYMSYGLGFYEYFLLAEDIGAIGVPVINCGIECMIQGKGQGPAIGTPEFQKYVQDALDLVEFCKGDKNTKWGAVRTAMGHEKPFELKYIGIGNEQWGRNFFDKYKKFVEAFDKAKKDNPALYGDVELMFSAGADDGDSGIDYIPAYREASSWLKSNTDKKLNDFAGVIDHHYYNSPQWFLEHADYYDEKNYSRDIASMTTSKFGGAIPVFVGEYASQSNTYYSALAEAAYMTGLERNGDIVKMAAYAPLFGNTTALHWAPDLIWFNNHTSTASVNYYVQQIFAKNAGTTLLKSDLNGAAIVPNPFKGKVGVGTWSTSAEFDNVKITDNETGKVLAADDFSADDFSLNWEKASDGNWSIKNGKLIQSSTSTDTNMYASTGTVAYYGDVAWKNYTYTLEAKKTGGSEGFLIPFSVGNSDNNYFWNIGGWDNTVSCLQNVDDGVKSDQIAGTVKRISLTNNTTYKIKVVVKDNNVKCYLNDSLYVDFTPPVTTNAESYHVVSTDKSGDIIVKMVNVTDAPKTFAIDIAGNDNIKETAAVDLVSGNSLKDDNILGEKEVVTMTSSEITGISKQFNYTVPKYSVTALRIKTK